MTKTNNTLSEKNYQNESLFGSIGVPLSKLSLLSEFLDAKEDQAMNCTSTMSVECLSGMRRTLDNVIQEIFTIGERFDGVDHGHN
ncbi:MAG: hypothetical protein KKF12_21940 [Proteobacteria bacterium]|nr:hypothetical protein [Desulfobacula sp.]MBU4133490.1 hypothetical protein [Pseudomonadota bacterium]